MFCYGFGHDLSTKQKWWISEFSSCVVFSYKWIKLWIERNRKIAQQFWGQACGKPCDGRIFCKFENFGCYQPVYTMKTCLHYKRTTMFWWFLETDMRACYSSALSTKFDVLLIWQFVCLPTNCLNFGARCRRQFIAHQWNSVTLLPN